jgi:hypothetical protein
LQPGVVKLSLMAMHLQVTLFRVALAVLPWVAWRICLISEDQR